MISDINSFYVMLDNLDEMLDNLGVR
jgi:hypothetical protein